jgi:hypothetical protein
MSATNDLLENAHACGVAFDKGEPPQRISGCILGCRVHP